MFAICAPVASLMVIFRGQIKEECIFCLFCQDYCFCSSKLKVSRVLFFSWMNDTMNNVFTLYLSMKSDCLICVVFTQQNDNMLYPGTLVVFLGWKKQCLILTFCMFLFFLMNCLESKGKHLFSTHLTVINTFGLQGSSFVAVPGLHMNLVLYTERKKFLCFTCPARDEDTEPVHDCSICTFGLR